MEMELASRWIRSSRPWTRILPSTPVNSRQDHQAVLYWMVPASHYVREPFRPRATGHGLAYARPSKGSVMERELPRLPPTNKSPVWQGNLSPRSTRIAFAHGQLRTEHEDFWQDGAKIRLEPGFLDQIRIDFKCNLEPLEGAGMPGVLGF